MFQAYAVVKISSGELGYRTDTGWVPSEGKSMASGGS